MATMRFVIRDGVENDVAACLRLDHSYETDAVWQMHIHQEEPNHWTMGFKGERLPRTLEISHLPDESRLRDALPPDQCFLVATQKPDEEILGYLTLFNDTAHGIGLIRDLVVSRPYRRHEIGTRLVNVARRWTKEHNLTRLMIQTQTKNYPAIQFCQATGFTFCGFNDRYFPNQDIAVFFCQSVR
jgi:GNAT superfamily N-acetyltransferase